MLVASASAIALPQAPADIPTDGVLCNIDSTTNQEICSIFRAPVTGIEKRAIIGKVYWSNNGYVKFIIPWIVNNQFAQAFHNSGYNLAKSMVEDMRFWIQSNSDLGTETIAAFSEWSGQLDLKSRYLSDLVGTTANYATIAVLANTGNGNNAFEIANAMARWYSQSGYGSDVISTGDTSAEFWGNSVNSKLKRFVGNMEERSQHLESRDDMFCTSYVHSMWRAGDTQHTPRGLWYDTNC